VGLQRYTVSVENFQGYAALWRQYRDAWKWPCIFTVPFWLETVCRHLGAPGEPHIAVVCDARVPIGVVPLALEGTTAAFLGDKEVCDYQDLVAAPGMQMQVMETVVGHLGAHGISNLDLRTIRPDAAVLCALRLLAPGRSPVASEQVDVTHETDLPQTWEAFLLQLNAKQRHEVRRKVRRLEKEADFTFRRFDNAGESNRAADTFVTLFRGSRGDKAAFMTGGMVGYFNDLIAILAHHDLLRLYFLEVGGQPAATVLCFDHNGVRYLYNSGYDDKYDHLSVGILSKIFSIQSGIEMGCRHYDFLRGAEIYKKRIGGNEVPLYRCRMEI
jgi:CelD/BcsL family acetyltransferase involved in cellulose biosynthesis